ncbi:MAG TPA: hypothetical protein VN181_03120 [Thermoanaerobaculia bacterium]|nr:hypothetical protein [Thermoanaerobaculia bacterium]
MQRTRSHIARAARAFLAAMLLGIAALSANALELVRPAPGATLRGGTFATLEWKADALPPESEEWEAFLSVNGGRYYAFRITPHLEIDMRRFDFVVPNIDASDATILIRTGDEREETVFELPGSLSIVHDDRGGAMPARTAAAERGEAARPYDRGVVAWAEGARDGSGVTFVTGARPTDKSLVQGTGIAGDPNTTLTPDQLAVHIRHSATLRRASIPSRSATAALPPRSRDLLLLCRRRNI